MKTERRHELQENELANWLGEKITKIQPYGKTILGVGVLIVAVLFAVSYINGRGAETEKEAWSAYFRAMNSGDPVEFRDMAADYPGTVAAGWSLQSAGDLFFNQGVGKLFQNRSEAMEQLQTARDAYEVVVKTYVSDPMLQARAKFGLAKAEEAMGNLDSAKAKYEELAKQTGDSEMAKLAQQRVDQLDRPATQAWYTWFAEQKPATSPLNEPGFFQDLPNLPERPDLNMPEPGQLLGPGSKAGNVLDLPEALDEPNSDNPSDNPNPLKLELDPPASDTLPGDLLPDETPLGDPLPGDPLPGGSLPEVDTTTPGPSLDLPDLDSPELDGAATDAVEAPAPKPESALDLEFTPPENDLN